MDDNPSLSDEVRERYRTMYSGVFYRRFILGEWVMAQGAIYRDAWSDELLLAMTSWSICSKICTS